MIDMKTKLVELGEICVLINGDRGKNYPSQADIVDNGEIPFVNAGHLVENQINFEQMNYISRDKFDKLSSGKIIDGDILYCLRGSLGKKAIVTGINEGAIASSLVIIRPNQELVTSKYLSLALESSSISTQLFQANNGSSQPNLSAKSVREYKIALHNIQEQDEIVTKISTVKRMIDNRKEQLSLLDNLIKSRFVELFGDPIYNTKHLPVIGLGKACNMKAGKFIKASDIRSDYEESLYPCFGGNGIRGYVTDYTHEGFMPLIGRQGALCGNLQYTTGKFYATEHAIVAQPLIGWNPLWLYIMLREMDLNRLATGAAQPGLNVSTLVPLEVINPDIQLQNEFAEFVQQVDKLKVEVQKSLEETQLLFDSLMQKYFD